VASDRILLLDPLGQPPREHSYNTAIERPANGSRILPVLGSFYDVDVEAEAGILRWRLPRSPAKKRPTSTTATRLARRSQSRRAG
jgi:hypothetical protein